MKKIILAYVVSALGRTGPTRQLYNLVKYMDPNQFQVELIALSLNPQVNLEKEFSELNIRLHSLKLNRFISLLAGRRRLNAILKFIKPDIVHSQGFRSDSLCAVLDQYPTRISTQRNNPFEDYPALYGTLIGSATAYFHYHALSRIPIVVACSKSIAYRNMAKRIQSVVIRNGVELEERGAPNTTSGKSKQRQLLNLPINGRLFVYAGPLIVRKDPKLLIRSFLSHADKSDTLCLLGEGALLPACRKLAKDHQNIILPGLVRNVADYLLAADLFVSASHAEGMPNAALEALATGLPVILSDIPAHREILEICSEVGWLFPLGSPIALGKCFDQAVPNISTQQAASALIKRHFSAQAMSTAYQQLYKSTLNCD